MYKLGQVFEDRDTGEVYILCQPMAGYACLINLRSGNRYGDPVEVCYETEGYLSTEDAHKAHCFDTCMKPVEL